MFSHTVEKTNAAWSWRVGERHWGKTSPPRRWCSTGTVCPGRLLNLCAQRLPRLSHRKPLLTWSGVGN